MLQISPQKIAHIIVRAREMEVKVESWGGARDSDDSDNILADLTGDATGLELKRFIRSLNDDEQAELVAVAWIGRGTFEAEELDDAIETAKIEKVNPTEQYLMGIPLLSDYLEDGMDKLGISLEEAEEGVI